MASDYELPNWSRPPQQAQGSKWPIVVLLLGVVTLALALTACGGSSSTSTPDATTGSPQTTTMPPASTPTPEPTEAAEVGESAETSREELVYSKAFFALSSAEQRPATWGEAADQTQKYIDFIEKNEPPEELREFFEAIVTLDRLRVRFAEGRRSLSYEDEDAQHAFNNNPERTEAYNTLLRAHKALDDDVLEILESGC